ncbi:MAG: sugar ABC transporter permease, partial [Chloroflexota bacterium]|nr:sugar ABC transporter permease [Chloroflexota bacterium]
MVSTTPETAGAQVGQLAPVRPTRRYWPTRRERGRMGLALLFISPWIIGFLAFMVYPFYYLIRISFTQTSGFGEPVWIGLDNYRRMLDDSVLHTSIYNTLYFLALAVPIGIVIAMALALCMNSELPEIPLYRVLIYLPSVLPLFAISLIAITMLDPSRGIVNELFRYVGWNPPNWLGNPGYAKIAIIGLAQYGAGQTALIFLAGLKGIPVHLYEAARLDGAGSWNRFRNITLPLMTPIILFNLISGVSASLQVFTQAYIMTRGGPANATNFYMYYLYQNAFQFGGQLGYAFAMGVVLFIVTFIIAALIFYTSSRWVHYD